MNNNLRPLIGLHGPQGAGKDTLARLMLSQGPAIGARFKFATALYAMAAAFDPLFHPDMAHADKMSPVLGQTKLGTRRAFLQKLGTEFGRNDICSTIWLDKMDAELTNFWSRGSEGKLAIVTDVRFEDEADYIRQHGVLVHLVPDWIVFKTAHPSDVPLEQATGDYVIHLQEGYFKKGLDQLETVYRKSW